MKKVVSPSHKRQIAEELVSGDRCKARPFNGTPPRTQHAFTLMAIAAISAWYWFRTMKSRGFHFQRLEASLRSAPTSSGTGWLSIAVPPMASKSGTRSGTNNLIVQKPLPTRTEMNLEFSYVN